MWTKFNADEGRVAVARIKSMQEKEVGLKAWCCLLLDAQQHFSVPTYMFREFWNWILALQLLSLK